MLFEDTLNAGSAYNIYVHQVYRDYKFEEKKVLLNNKKKTKREVSMHLMSLSHLRKRERGETQNKRKRGSDG